MVFDALSASHEKASVLQAAKDISSILVGERAKRHTKLGDPNARAALALAINPNVALMASSSIKVGKYSHADKLLAAALPGSKFRPDM